MNKEIEEKLYASMGKIAEYLEKTADFTAEQAPLLVQEVLAYFTLLAWVNLGITVAWLLAWLLLAVVAWKLALGEHSKITESSEHGTMMGACGSFAIIFSVATLIQIHGSFDRGKDVLKIEKAPRLYLIEQMRDLTAPKKERNC